MNRWTHLARHGLLGGTLVGALAAPAAAEPCDAASDAPIVGFTLGLDLAPRVTVTGGIEVRQCLSASSEAFARLELGGGGTRLLGGARVRPFEDGDAYTDDEAQEKLGVQAGVAIDLAGTVGGHLAGSYGYSYAYLAVEALFPLTSRPNVPSATRTSLVGGFSPWTTFKSTAVEGRPIAVGGRIVTPAVIAQLASARTAEDRAVRDHFTRAARFEYSSVWTFLRLAAELAAVGAPAQLVAAALDAADDEVRHAELCARAAGGLALSPLALAAAQPRFTRRSPAALATLAHEAWIEGCLNEGAAAREAAFAAAAAHGAIATTLATIARDEAAHAALSWAVLAWVAEVAPAIARTATADAPSGAAAAAPAALAGAHDTADDRALARRGVASPVVRAAALAQAHADARVRRRERVG